MLLTDWNTNEVGDICLTLCTVFAALSTEIHISFTVLEVWWGFFVVILGFQYLDCVECNANLSE